MQSLIQRHLKREKKYVVLGHPGKKTRCVLSSFVQSPGFKKMLIDTVFDGLKEQLKLNVNREKVIFLQMAYKGTPVPTVIRTKMQTPPEVPISMRVAQMLVYSPTHL